MVDKQSTVEQLCFTWSNIGITDSTAGYRERAASEGLDNLSELQRYEGYSLPMQAINASDVTLVHRAPVCLSLLRLDKKRILLQKVYVGKDGVGRPGNYFIHFFVGLPQPEVFSALDAIRLWDSPLFKRSEKDLTKSTVLKRETLQNLQSSGRDIPANTAARHRTHDCFPYLVEAYLTKRAIEARPGQQAGPQKIYIAAPDEDIAYYIFGLILCLPLRLVKELTFSTYEHNLDEAHTEIVGTSALRGDESREYTDTLLPDRYYQGKLAINCYTGKKNPLKDNPLTTHDPRAEEYAQDALEYLEHGKVTGFDFKDMLREANTYENLTPEMLLNIHQTYRKPPSKEIIEQVVKDPVMAARTLSRSNYREALINFAIYEADWWEKKLRSNLASLHNHSARLSDLSSSLVLLARDAASKAAFIINANFPPMQNALTKYEAFKKMIDVFNCAIPMNEESNLRRFLLSELAKTEGCMDFLMGYPGMYNYLLQEWAKFLSPDAQTNALIARLLQIPWPLFGQFLLLEIHLEWKAIAIRWLILQPVEVHTIQEMGKHDDNQINVLFQQLGQQTQEEAMGRYWSIAIDLYSYLVNNTYRGNLRLLFTLLRSPLGKNESYTAKLLDKARLAGAERSTFLDVFGKEYLPSTLLLPRILTIFSELARSTGEESKKQWSIVRKWLDEQQLAEWFDAPDTGIQNFNAVLGRTLLNVEESVEFFRLYGNRFIPRDPSSPILLKLFQAITSQSHPEKIMILLMWLPATKSKDEMEKLLDTAQLTWPEKVQFLEAQGQHYLSRYPTSSILLQYAEAYINTLPSFGGGHSAPRLPAGVSSARENFYQFLLNSSLALPAVQRLRDFYTLEIYSKAPSLDKERQTEAIAIMARLSKDAQISPEKRRQIWMGFVGTFTRCIENEVQLTSILTSMQSEFELDGVLNFFINVVEGVATEIKQKRYRVTMYEPYIKVAFSVRSILTMSAMPVEREQIFVERILGALLQGVSVQALNWLNDVSEDWLPTDISMRWQRYARQLQVASPVAPVQNVIRKQIDPKQREAALAALRKALNKGSIEEILVQAQYVQQEHILQPWKKTIAAAHEFSDAYNRGEDDRITGDEREKREAAIVKAVKRIEDLNNTAHIKLNKVEKKRYQEAEKYLIKAQAEKAKNGTGNKSNQEPGAQHPSTLLPPPSPQAISNQTQTGTGGLLAILRPKRSHKDNGESN